VPKNIKKIFHKSPLSSETDRLKDARCGLVGCMLKVFSTQVCIYTVQVSGRVGG